ncbi:hypothetical protein FGG79_00770 [Bacillus sp. BHET2]|uniref:hypothetical protein n=1 Tax=Bacillus sp. BHET2 TaxID=2583818 RepID=UPI00110EC71C|nr:hypothetical protein [Bacillus sp. BHET2]TMU86713.1 hypothetical protein FGG79_00770 [Bacillus sp. BHET2]
MNKSEWKNRDIEELVKKLPQIKDERTSQYIYARIKRENKKKNFVLFNRFFPAVAALAAILIMILLAPTVLTELTDNSMEKSELNTADRSGSSEENKKAVMSTESEKSDKLPEPNKDQKMTLTDSDQSTAEEKIVSGNSSSDRLSLYADDLQGNDYYTFGLVSQEAVPIPVSVIDSSNGEDWLSRHEQIAENIPEADWGLEEYLPLKGKFTHDQNKVIFTLDADHSYSGSSAVEYAFYHSLQYSFQHKGIDEVVLQEQDGSVPQFSSTGEFSKIDVTGETRTAYYLYSPNGKDRYLVPDNIDRGNVKESIAAMKQADSSLFQSVIPKDINISVMETDEYVTASFLNELNLETLDDTTALEMIEGILLTSRSAGYEKVLFENIKQESWNGFHFNEPIETPISPNRKDLMN